MEVLHAHHVCTAVWYTDAPLAVKPKVYKQIMVSIYKLISLCLKYLDRCVVNFAEQFMKNE